MSGEMLFCAAWVPLCFLLGWLIAGASWVRAALVAAALVVIGAPQVAHADRRIDNDAYRCDRHRVPSSMIAGTASWVDLKKTRGADPHWVDRCIPRPYGHRVDVLRTYYVGSKPKAGRCGSADLYRVRRGQAWGLLVGGDKLCLTNADQRFLDRYMDGWKQAVKS